MTKLEKLTAVLDEIGVAYNLHESWHSCSPTTYLELKATRIVNDVEQRVPEHGTFNVVFADDAEDVYVSFYETGDEDEAAAITAAVPAVRAARSLLATEAEQKDDA